MAFSRNPDTGERSLDGEFCFGEGEDINTGVREPRHINDLKEWGAANRDERENGGPIFQELKRLVRRLEEIFGDVQEVEFTIQNGSIFILESGSASRSPKANVKFAVQMVNEGIISARDAILRVNALQMGYFQKSIVHPNLERTSLNEKLLGTGLPVTSGAVTGIAVFSTDSAEQCYRNGNPCILIKKEASIVDMNAIAAVDGILCMEGGSSSFIVEICRPLNRTCIVGAQLCGLSVGSTRESKEGTGYAVYDCNGHIVIKEGQVITLDGNSGKILKGVVRCEVEACHNDCNGSDNYQSTFRF